MKQEFKDEIFHLIDEKLNTKPREIVMCNNCGFVYHDPTLTGAELEVLYEKYRDTSFRKESPDEYFDRITSLPKAESLNYKKTIRIDSFLKQYWIAPNSELLSFYDVGTGGGVFVKTFLDNSSYAWGAYGVEPTITYANLAKRRLGLPIINSFYTKGLHQKQFDLITVNKVLEHSSDPLSFLSDLREDLKAWGLIYIEVPSAKEVFTLPPDHQQLQYDHLIFFSVETLTHLMKNSGLQIKGFKKNYTPMERLI